MTWRPTDASEKEQKMTELMEKVGAKLAELPTRDASGFAELVKRVVAEGDAVDPDDVADRLDRMGCTCEELNTAVELLERRIVAAATLAKRAEAEEAVKAAGVAIGGAEAAFARDSALAGEAHVIHLQTLQHQQQLAAQQVAAAGRARHELMDTASAALRAAWHTATSERNAATRQRDEAAEILAENRVKLEQTEAAPVGSTNPQAVDQKGELVGRFRSTIRADERKLAEAERLLLLCQTAVADAKAELLQP